MQWCNGEKQWTETKAQGLYCIYESLKRMTSSVSGSLSSLFLSPSFILLQDNSFYGQLIYQMHVKGEGIWWWWGCQDGWLYISHPDGKIEAWRGRAYTQGEQKEMTGWWRHRSVGRECLTQLCHQTVLAWINDLCFMEMVQSQDSPCPWLCYLPLAHTSAPFLKKWYGIRPSWF